mmetsp:Transcript_31923/g.98830  ORF Transcript_31923/g.98830 Transcript_31923/m.98830 type:complete len:327 (-) Transcript_31923:326-1306(-)
MTRDAVAEARLAAVLVQVQGVLRLLHSAVGGVELRKERHRLIRDVALCLRALERLLPPNDVVASLLRRPQRLQLGSHRVQMRQRVSDRLLRARGAVLMLLDVRFEFSSAARRFVVGVIRRIRRHRLVVPGGPVMPHRRHGAVSRRGDDQLHRRRSQALFEVGRALERRVSRRLGVEGALRFRHVDTLRLGVGRRGADCHRDGAGTAVWISSVIANGSRGSPVPMRVRRPPASGGHRGLGRRPHHLLLMILLLLLLLLLPRHLRRPRGLRARGGEYREIDDDARAEPRHAELHLQPLDDALELVRPERARDVDLGLADGALPLRCVV